jgi:hypothetical protein
LYAKNKLAVCAEVRKSAVEEILQQKNRSRRTEYDK